MRFSSVLVWCYVICASYGQQEEQEEVAAQLFELQRVMIKSEGNEIKTKNQKMAKQFFKISPGNPFLQPNVPVQMDRDAGSKQEEKQEAKRVYEINPENPFLQQFLVSRSQPEVSTARPRRTSTQRVTTSTTRRPVSRITTPTPSTTTYRQIPGLMLYLSPTIEETKRRQPRPKKQQPQGTTSSPIIGSFLPKTNANIVNVFQRLGEAGIEAETVVEQPVLSDDEIEELFGNYEAMKLAPKLFVS